MRYKADKTHADTFIFFKKHVKTVTFISLNKSPMSVMRCGHLMVLSISCYVFYKALCDNKAKIVSRKIELILQSELINCNMYAQNVSVA